jgi:ribosomal protein S18 acetylase RimI-like enzyme
MTTSVRPARPDDLPRVARLAAELVRQHHRMDARRFMLIEPIAEGYLAFFRKELTRKRVVILVAESPPAAGAPAGDPAIVGYAYGTLEGRNWNDLLDACGKLNDLFVAPEARRAGAGALLVKEMLSALRARGAPRVVLLTAWMNEAAHAFFARLGFRRTMLEMTAELDVPPDEGVH